MARLLMKRDHIVSERFVPGTLQKAEQELRTAISLDENFCDAHVVLGYLLYLTHKYPDALQELDRADALACASPWRLMNRIDVDMALRRFDDASSALAKVPATLENVTPTLRASIETKARMTQVWIAFNKGDQAGMLEPLRQEVKLAPPDDAWSIGNAAQSFMLAGAFEEAADTAREALRRRNYGAAQQTLGVALFGDSLWRSSRGASTQDQRAVDEWTEAESLVEFGDAGKQLWGSLANRDVAFRALLQTKIAENHPQKAQEAK